MILFCVKETMMLGLMYNHGSSRVNVLLITIRSSYMHVDCRDSNLETDTPEKYVIRYYFNIAIREIPILWFRE